MNEEQKMQLFDKLSELSPAMNVRFAIFCANQVKHLWQDFPEAVAAVEVAEGWLEGRVSVEECENAAYKTDDVVNVYNNTDINAIHTTYYVAQAAAKITLGCNEAATEAADAATKTADNDGHEAKIMADQQDYYQQLLEFTEVDRVFEKTVLEHRL